MSEWRLDQVGRQFDEEPSSAPLSARDSRSAAMAGRSRSERSRTKGGDFGWVWLLLAAVLLGGAGGFGIWYLFLAPTPTGTIEPVLINADTSPIRIAPDDPGGMEVPHQERLVLQDFEDQGPPTEATARPAPEQPIPVAPTALVLPPQPTETPEATAPPTDVALVDTALADTPSVDTLSVDITATDQVMTDDAALAEPASIDATSVDPAPAETAAAPAVEVLMPRLAETTETPPTSDSAAEPRTVTAEPAATEIRAEPVRPATPAGHLTGPLTATTMGRDPSAPDASAAADPFVDLVTALTWPSERRSLPQRPAASLPIGGSPLDSPARRVDVAALAGAASPQPAAALPAPEAAAPDTMAPPVNRDAIGPRFVPQPDAGFRVQIVAVQAEAEAASEWDRFSRLYPGLLGGFEPFVQQIDLGDRGIWYRVQAGPLDWAGANELCTALQEQGADCLVRRR